MLSTERSFVSAAALPTHIAQIASSEPVREIDVDAPSRRDDPTPVLTTLANHLPITNPDQAPRPGRRRWCARQLSGGSSYRSSRCCGIVGINSRKAGVKLSRALKHAGQPVAVPRLKLSRWARTRRHFVGLASAAILEAVSSFYVDVVFHYGYCELTLHQGLDSMRMRNHWGRDGFVEFVSAVRRILTGVPVGSVLWLGEPGSGGYFLDFVSDPTGAVHVAVHETYYPWEELTTPTKRFSAARGAVRFEGHVSGEEFATACAAALRRVRSTQVETTGLVVGSHWPHPFPQAEFERVERLAGRYPYTPENALQGNI